MEYALGNIYWTGPGQFAAPVKLIAVHGDEATIQYCAESLAGKSRRMPLAKLHDGTQPRTPEYETTKNRYPRTAAEEWDILAGVIAKSDDYRARRALRKYRIEYYGSDGSPRDPSVPMPGEGHYPTLEAARSAIREALGGRMYGRWSGDPGDDDPGSIWETQEAWHESDDKGCGGYVILRRKN